MIRATLLTQQAEVTNTWVSGLANQPPLVHAGPDQSILYGTPVNLAASATDDGQPNGTLELSWRTVAGPAPARLAEAHQGNTTVSFDYPGTYVLEWTAHDSMFAARDRISITVDAVNLLPRLAVDTPYLLDLYVGDDVFFRGDASDIDGQIVRIEMYQNGALVAQTRLDDFGEWEFDHSLTQSGPATFYFEAIDDRGGRTRSQEFTTVIHELRVALTQVTAYSAVGGTKSVTVRTMDESGAAVPWTTVIFQVTGANPTSGYLATMENGEATFTYPGTVAGQDVIEATMFSSPFSARLTNTWVVPTTNQPPVVAASAVSNAIFHRPVPLQATVSDDGFPNGQLTYSWRVQTARYPGVHIADPGALNTTVTFDYADPWQDYELEFSASDGMFVARAVVRIRVTDNVPPNIFLTTSPDTNQFNPGQSVTLSATVFDEDDFYVYVDFYEGLNFIGQKLRASTSTQVVTQPFIFQRRGTHQFTARARDNRGVVVVSEAVNVFSGARPTGEWLQPLDGQSLLGGKSQLLSVQATDPDGTVASVIYLLQTNDTLVALGPGTGPQFALTWTPNFVGPAVLVARVTDNDGLPAEELVVQVEVVGPAALALAHPTVNALLDVDQPVPFVVELEDPAQSVTNFEFRVDGAVFTRGESPAAIWTPSQPGAHTLQAFADDVLGRRIATPIVPVTVAELIPPTVTLLTPTNDARFLPGSAIMFSAAGTDPDGSITNLVIKADGFVVAETNSSQLAATWTGATPGWHEAVVEARDDTGQTGSSAVGRFFVVRPLGAALPAPGTLLARGLTSDAIELTWLMAPTNSAVSGVLIERWDPSAAGWVEIEALVGDLSGFVDSALAAETLHRYRIAFVAEDGGRSAYSTEAEATTRTRVPNYAVIDLTEAVASTLLAQRPVSNPLTNSGFINFDSRRGRTLGGGYIDGEMGTNATAFKLAVARFKERWPQIQLDYDPVLITPGSILSRDGYLTGPGGVGVTVQEATAQLFPATDPNRSIKAFLHEHQALFGHGTSVLDTALVQRDYTLPGNGARTVVFQQQVGGVPVFNALLIGHLTAARELAALSSSFVPDPVAAVDPALAVLVENGGPLPMAGSNSVAAALAHAGDQFGVGDMLTQSTPQGLTRKQTFTAARGLKGEGQAELTWFPNHRTQLRLAWQVLFTSQWHDKMYLTLVAADTGEVLLRRDLTTTSDAASYRVFTGSSPAPLSPGLSSPSAVQPPRASRSLVSLVAVSTNASPDGWLPPGVNETRGNNVDAYLDRNDDDAVDSRPIGNPARVFDLPLDLDASALSYGDAAAVQLFYWNNWMHDALYGFGFTEAAGNFQGDNFGRGGTGNDAVRAQAQDGLSLNDRRHVNNANMSTPPDGYAPRMQMYVFNGAEPDRDGSLDAEIVLHEYSHGLSGRLIGGGAGIDALATAGMGEGWSDFYALALLTDPANNVDGVYPMGGYATFHAFGGEFEENYYFGIRRYPYCTDTNKNPLTFRDIDPLQAQAHAGVPRSSLTGPFRAETASEVHRQGEVWGQMLWEVRAGLIRKHGPSQGNSLALQLVTDGLRLSPPNPNYVQARDAILLADRMWSGGVNRAEIWSAFAKRGLGYNAKAPDSRTTSGVRESYEIQPALGPDLVEIQGGNGDGVVQSGEDNLLLVHVGNQGNGPATQVSGQISTATAHVEIVAAISSYADIPAGQSRANTVAFQIRTSAAFIEGSPIDLTFSIASATGSSASPLRIFTGVPNSNVPVDNYNGIAPAEVHQGDLSPIHVENMESLWMAENGNCLLKAGEGHYVLWRPHADPIEMSYPGFVAHRLTRDSVVVGEVAKPSTVDGFGHQVKHSRGVKWTPGEPAPVELSSDGGPYRFPKQTTIESLVGSVFNISDSSLQGYVSEFPTLHALWDLNRGGQAAGHASVYVRPADLDHDGVIEPIDVRLGLGNFANFDSHGAMAWEELSERGFSAGNGSGAAQQVNYNALLTTAALFEQPQWRWLGPLSFVPDHNAAAIATLINEAGTVGGYGAIVTDNPDFNVWNPTHAFRWISARGEFGEGATLLTLDAQPVLEDVGVLGGGLFSQPYALNQKGEMVGYSDFGQIQGGTVSYNDYNFHAVFWAAATNAPEDLGSFGPVGPALSGYSYAYDVNDLTQIVGTSYRPPQDSWSATSAGVLWQRNWNTNGIPFWQLDDLNRHLSDSSWLIQSAVSIASNGTILAQGPNLTPGPSLSSPEAPVERSALIVPIEINSLDRYVEIRISEAYVNSMGGFPGFGLAVIGGTTQPLEVNLRTAKVYGRETVIREDEGIFFPEDEALARDPDPRAYEDPIAVSYYNGFFTFVTVIDQTGPLQISLRKDAVEQLSMDYLSSPHDDMSELIDRLDAVFTDSFTMRRTGLIQIALTNPGLAALGGGQVENRALVAKASSGVFEKIKSAVKQGVVLYVEGVKVAVVGAQGFVQGFWGGMKNDAKQVADFAKMVMHPVDTGKALYEGFRGLISMSLADLKKIPGAMLAEFLTDAQKNIQWAQPTGLDLIAYSIGYSAGYLSEQILVAVVVGVFKAAIVLPAAVSIGGKVAKMMSTFKAGKKVLDAVEAGKEVAAKVQRAKNFAVKAAGQFVKDKIGFDEVEAVVKKVLLVGCPL